MIRRSPPPPSRKISVRLPLSMIDALDVSARRNRDVEPGYGDTRRDLIECAVWDWLAQGANPTKAELRALRRSRR